MAGMNQGMVDYVLGYEDDYTSDENRRQLYVALWSIDARPNMILQLRGTKVILRPPGNDAEYAVALIVSKTLYNMMRA